MPSSDRTLIALNPVRAERADDFEAWIRSVVVPAAQEHQAHLYGRWRVLRGSDVEDGVVVFAFLFDGGTEEDWELLPLLEKALGPEGAQRALTEMQEMLQADQYGWSFSDVRLDGA